MHAWAETFARIFLPLSSLEFSLGEETDEFNYQTCRSGSLALDFVIETGHPCRCEAKNFFLGLLLFQHRLAFNLAPANHSIFS